MRSGIVMRKCFYYVERKKYMSNEAKLKQLIEQAGITQLRASELITAQTTVPCSVRSVRAWLTDKDNASARTCPDWAVNALAAAVAKHASAEKSAH